MKLIARPKKMGKTTDLIHLSAKTGALIVTRDRNSADRIFRQAKELGLNIPFPVDYHEFLDKTTTAGKGRHILIDDADDLLRGLTWASIDAVTFTDEGEEF